MRVPRSLLQCLVFAASTTLAFGQSVNSDDEPQLGPVVPLSSYASDSSDLRLVLAEPELGPVIPIASSFEADADELAPLPLTFSKDEVQYFPGSEAMPNPRFAVPRVIAHPIAAQTIEPSPFGLSSACPIPVHPDEIQFHLSAVSGLLANLGLAHEAKQIQEFQQQFHRDHYQRLLIAQKESQLSVLQAEIANLKQNPQSVVGETQSECAQPSTAIFSTRGPQPIPTDYVPRRTVLEAKALSDK